MNQQYNEFRTTKTNYPTRRLMKKFANTADFCLSFVEIK